MKPGDFVNIPAFKKHRVDWTTPDEPTVWLEGALWRSEVIDDEMDRLFRLTLRLQFLQAPQLMPLARL
jgi:hypothetical protein